MRQAMLKADVVAIDDHAQRAVAKQIEHSVERQTLTVGIGLQRRPQRCEIVGVLMWRCR
jgi:hypothetical protein